MLTAFLRAGFRLSLSGAVAALCVWVGCRILHRLHAPRRLCCALWLAAMLFFLLPFRFSVPVPAFMAAAPASFGEMLQEISPAAQGHPAVAPQSAVSGAAQKQTDTAAPAFSGISEAGPGWAGAGKIIFFVWLLGVAGFGGHSIYQAARLRRRLLTACRMQAADGTVYYVGSGIDAPFLYGLFRPRIYLPGALSAAQRRCILAHEQAHLRCGDFWAKPLAFAVVCLHWFNPAAWLAFGALTKEMESACDEAALARLGEGCRQEYCTSLLTFAEAQAGLCRVAFGTCDARRRIAHLVSYRRPGRLRLAVCLCLALLCVACAASRPAAAGPASSGGLTLSAPGAASASQAFSAALAQDGSSPAESDVAPAPNGPGSEAAAALQASYLWPVPDFTKISVYPAASQAGQGSSSGPQAAHAGVDIAAKAGAPILAAADGTVVYAGYNEAGFGKMVVLLHEGGVYSLYAHCEALSVSAGQAVSAGDEIASVGNTGNSTGPHLHFELGTGFDADTLARNTDFALQEIYPNQLS